jgi:pilus assembly protein CpaE
MLLELMRSGIDEWLGDPFDLDQVSSALERVDQFLAENPPLYDHPGHVFSFFPAKPGSGASTVALNTAAAVARLSRERTALIDLDLNHGIIEFLLKLGEGASIRHALEHSQSLDEDLWGKMVARSGGLDILRSGAPSQQPHPGPAQVEDLLSFAERAYPVTCVDLSGDFDDGSVTVMDHSALVFQVCSTDFASLHLARRNMDLFGQFSLRHKVRTIVNRAIFRNGLKREGLEEILGTEAFACIPSSYVELQSAIADGRMMDPTSSLSGHFDRLARQVLGVHEEGSPHNADSGSLRLPALRSAVSTFRQRMSLRKPPAGHTALELAATDGLQ